MIRDAKLHWFWRGMIVVFLGLSLRVTLVILGIWSETPIGVTWQLLGGDAVEGYVVAKSVAYTMPVTALCLAVFALLGIEPPKERVSPAVAGVGTSYEGSGSHDARSAGRRYEQPLRIPVAEGDQSVASLVLVWCYCHGFGRSFGVGSNDRQLSYVRSGCSGASATGSSDKNRHPHQRSGSHQSCSHLYSTHAGDMLSGVRSP